MNIYAPAECTISALFHEIKAEDQTIPGTVPIGRCLPGRKVFVLDSYVQQILPDGRSIGEIYLGGIGIFAGYLNKPEESARVLVELAQSNGIFYRTGDMGKITNNGELIFIGRRDFQVKLRGQRIELGEIETVIMRSSSNISNCVVIKVTHNYEEHLVVYLQTTTDLDQLMIRDYCTQHFPLYMVPSLFILLDHFPLNENGKLDRQALSPPDFSLLLHSSNVTLENDDPQTDVERKIASIWIEVLCLETIPSINMSFFRLGGHSLLLMKLHHRYQTQFNQSINISDLFRHTTIIDHVRLLKDHQMNLTESKWHSLNIVEGKGINLRDDDDDETLYPL